MRTEIILPWCSNNTWKFKTHIVSFANNKFASGCRERGQSQNYCWTPNIRLYKETCIEAIIQCPQAFPRSNIISFIFSFPFSVALVHPRELGVGKGWEWGGKGGAEHISAITWTPNTEWHHVVPHIFLSNGSIIFSIRTKM